MIVSVALIGTVMTALAIFFTTTVAVSGDQGSWQTAGRLAQTALDRVNALRGSAPTTGRDRPSSDTQWSSPVVGAASWLADLREAWDPAATFPSGQTAPLPTTTQVAPVDGVSYGQTWYVGRCWQPAAGGGCGPIEVAGSVEFFRVVVAVTWPGRRCAGGTCSYLTSTLISAAPGDPVFDDGPVPRPVVANPGDQIGEVTVPTGLQLVATAGMAPLTWSAFGLPAGVTLDSSGRVSGTPTAAGSYPVTVRLIDQARQVGIAGFTWTISALPALTSPGPQTTPGGSALVLPLVSTGGVEPLVWSVDAPGPWGTTGLPPGLSISPTTGDITGTPIAAGSGAVTVRVTDRFGMAATATFTWTVPALAVTTPAAQVGTVGVPVPPLPIAASGGVPPYAWSATGLPAGCTLDASGTITGTPLAAGTTTVVVTVTDDSGAAAATEPFTWTVS